MCARNFQNFTTALLHYYFKQQKENAIKLNFNKGRGEQLRRTFSLKSIFYKGEGVNYYGANNGACRSLLHEALGHAGKYLMSCRQVLNVLKINT